jgi:hypothetical protein
MMTEPKGRHSKPVKVAKKVAKTIYLSKETDRRLKAAADSEGMSDSVYVEQSLRERWRREAR